MGPIPYAKQSIDAADQQAVREALAHPYLTTGPAIADFESAFAQYVDASYAVAVSSGTAALHLCAKALEVGPESRALCPSLTFAASANCVLHEGGEIDFVDIDPQTGLMDIQLVEQKLKDAPPAYYSLIIAVDFAGFPYPMDKLRKLADQYGCKIIEDSCHAPGAFYLSDQGVAKSGNGAYADLSIFSFHPTKHITTGEGGMITTRSQELYEKLLRLRNHGICKDPERLQEQHGGWYYELQDLGLNYRMTDVQARLGISQLKKVDGWMERRREIAETYRRAFENTTITCLEAAEGHAYHLFVIKHPERKRLYDYLRQEQIYCQVHYVPLHIHPLYKEKGWTKGDLPATEAYYDHCLSLPMYPTLSKEEQAFVIEKIQAFS
ncbi:MAG: UDP-4-amino-4,6-dideoxy-N-acetyl-beta-L-altrosamine transaminase [Bacteroidota bacterium]